MIRARLTGQSARAHLHGYVLRRCGLGQASILPDNHRSRAYVLEGSVEAAVRSWQRAARPSSALVIALPKSGGAGRALILLGGETLNGPRHIWWNFVSSSREKIEHAKKNGQKGTGQDGLARPGDDAEHIPLPEPKRPGKHANTGVIYYGPYRRQMGRSVV